MTATYTAVWLLVRPHISPAGLQSTDIVVDLTMMTPREASTRFVVQTSAFKTSSAIRTHIAGSPDGHGSYLHYAPRTEDERREQRKAARLALVRRHSRPLLCATAPALSPC